MSRQTLLQPQAATRFSAAVADPTPRPNTTRQHAAAAAFASEVNVGAGQTELPHTTRFKVSLLRPAALHGAGDLSHSCRAPRVISCCRESTLLADASRALEGVMCPRPRRASSLMVALSSRSRWAQGQGSSGCASSLVLCEAAVPAHTRATTSRAKGKLQDFMLVRCACGAEQAQQKDGPRVCQLGAPASMCHETGAHDICVLCVCSGVPRLNQTAKQGLTPSHLKDDGRVHSSAWQGRRGCGCENTGLADELFCVCKHWWFGCSCCAQQL